MRLGTVDAYWVLPEQVSKEPQSGEFIGRGAFIIRGEKHYVKNIEMILALGEITYEGKRMVMCGPVSAVKSKTDKYAIITVGNEKKEKIAKELKKLFNVSADTIVKVLPPGDSQIVENRMKKD
jgi:ribosomal protein L23